MFLSLGTLASSKGSAVSLSYLNFSCNLSVAFNIVYWFYLNRRNFIARNYQTTYYLNAVKPNLTTTCE
jgi:hypothetical protein